MIVFLFGTWGSGKSFVGELIERECGLLHLEADIHFDKPMVNALHAQTFHQLDLTDYYNRVVSDIFSFKGRTNNFVVSQAIYEERFRQLIYEVFEPEVRFVWVKTENRHFQRLRLNQRSEKTGNPINGEMLAYMQEYWQEPQVPHEVLLNGPKLVEHTKKLLQAWGLCIDWES